MSEKEPDNKLEYVDEIREIRKAIEVVKLDIEEQKDPNALGQLYALLYKLKERLAFKERLAYLEEDKKK